MVKQFAQGYLFRGQGIFGILGDVRIVITFRKNKMIIPNAIRCQFNGCQQFIVKLGRLRVLGAG